MTDGVIRVLQQDWLWGVLLGFLLARIGSRLEAEERLKRNRQQLFNGYLDEIHGHDWQIELLLCAPDELRPLETAAWQQLKRSGELWSMEPEPLNYLVTYGELTERYNYHFREMDWLKRELLDHPNQQLLDYVNGIRQKLLHMLQQMRDVKRNTAFEVRWWMEKQGLLSRRKWDRWRKQTSPSREKSKPAQTVPPS